MKKTVVLLAVFASAIHLVPAQEVIPPAETLKASAGLWLSTGRITDMPLQVDPDIKCAYAVKEKEFAVVVVPETKLADAIAKAGEKAQPIGQLWLKGLAPSVDGSVVANSRMKMVEVAGKGGDDVALALCVLGVRKTEKNGLELVLYGKDKEPLKTFALKKHEAKQELPAEFEVIPGGGSAEVKLNLVGKYEASFSVQKQQE